MPNPLEAALKWFDSESREIKGDVAGLGIYVMALDINLETSMDGIIDGLRDWLKPGENKNLDVSKILLFRAAIEFNFRKRFSKQSWEQVISTTERGKELFSEDAKGLELMDHIAERVPFRAALWKKTGLAWDKLCANELSDENIEKFLFSRD